VERICRKGRFKPGMKEAARARVRASGTGVEPRAQLKAVMGWATGDGRGLDWVRSQTLSRLCRVGHEGCRVRKG